MFKKLKSIKDGIDSTINMMFEQPIIWIILFFMVLIVTPVPIFHTIHAFQGAIYDKQVSSRFFDSNLWNAVIFGLHTAISLPPVVFGLWMFHKDFRERRPDLHRILGYFYVVGCIVGGISVIPLALVNGVGFVPQLGFTVMAVLWTVLTYLAYTSAVNKDYVAHRRWMMRSYAMTFAFVHVNLTYKFIFYFFMLGDIQVSDSGIKAMQSMISWLFNLFVVEIYLMMSSPGGKILVWEKIKKNIVFYSKKDHFYLGPLTPSVLKKQHS